MVLFDRIEADPDVRVLVLTGTGRAFSAGYDLGSIAERASSAPEEQTRRIGVRDRRRPARGLAVPTICRLNGGVYGGSTDLALACDFRIGVDTCEMFMPAARLGCITTRAASSATFAARRRQRPKTVPDRREIGAAEMLRIGYLTAMAPFEALDAEVDRLAAVLAGNAPVAMRGMKRAINEFAHGRLDEAAADRRARDSMRSDEIKEGIRAFSEKRPPKF